MKELLNSLLPRRQFFIRYKLYKETEYCKEGYSHGTAPYIYSIDELLSEFVKSKIIKIEYDDIIFTSITIY